ncbi:MAG: 50S ribosome-binding GTPase [Phycisphaeraceae bacterium]|nr:MAG: 50S ribosome-binding GTPase [Phycisphaeraceae bacterium]
MIVGDTIAAVASPRGRAARAVVRLSGPGTSAVLDERVGPGARAGRGIRPARWRLSGGVVLPVLVISYHAPRSYTGQDAAEILCPGNPVLARRLLDDVLAFPGVRSAGPGEFTARAYFAGKLTLEQAEGVAALIAAEDEAQAHAARELLEGSAGARYRAWTSELADLAALVEAGIDFTDQEDVRPIAPAALVSRLASMGSAMRDAGADVRPVEAPSAVARVVLIGPPNAGKSTLFNALLGRTRAVASPRAGTTRDALAEPLDLGADMPGAGVVELIDLPGLDGTPGVDDLDRAARERAKAIAGVADVWIQCDPSGRFEASGVPPSVRPIPVIRVRTKADLPTADGHGGLGVCALDGWNLGPVRRAIADAAFSAGTSPRAAVAPRHARALASALRAVTDAGTLAGRPEWAPETVSAVLRDALDALEELGGRVTPDDVLGRVFSVFCVGK